MKFLPFVFAGMWLFARIVISQFFPVDKAVTFGALSNVLLILILIFLAIYTKYKKHTGERPAFFQDFRDCMLAAMKYVVATVLFIGLYYGVFSNDIETMRNIRTESFAREIIIPENYNQLIEQNPNLKGKSIEELTATNKENVERFVSVKSQVLGASLALTAVSLAYSLLAVFFWRSFIKRL